MTLKPDSANPLAELKTELVEIQAEFEPGDASEVALTVRGAVIVYDVKKQELTVNDHRAPAPLRDGKQRLTIFCDRNGLEIFAANGLTYIPMPHLPRASDLSLGVQAKGGSAKISELQVHELKSAWTAPDIKSSDGRRTSRVLNFGIKPRFCNVSRTNRIASCAVTTSG